tara:strand:+ start:410 stop:859 length:450 start_codon:yes stop_codon:yes gene_type:complete
MIIYSVFKVNYNNDPILNLNLEKYKDILDDNHVLILGLGYNHNNKKFPYFLHNDDNCIKWHNEGKKLYYLDFEEGSSFYTPYINRNNTIVPFENMADKIFTICPYTCNFVNNLLNMKKRVAIPFFFSEDFIQKNLIKQLMLFILAITLI